MSYYTGNYNAKPLDAGKKAEEAAKDAGLPTTAIETAQAIAIGTAAAIETTIVSGNYSHD